MKTAIELICELPIAVRYRLRLNDCLDLVCPLPSRFRRHSTPNSGTRGGLVDFHSAQLHWNQGGKYICLLNANILRGVISLKIDGEQSQPKMLFFSALLAWKGVRPMIRIWKLIGV